MQNRFLLILIALMGSMQLTTSAQTYIVKTVDTTFADAWNSTGNIPARIYYPTNAQGQLPAGLSFPVIGFGHGLAMKHSEYSIVLGCLVESGYIVVSADVQNGLFPTPNHTDFAKQIYACAQFMQAEGARAGSRWQGHVAPKSAVMGHSMGGGASMLALNLFSNIDAGVGLAPAQTTSTPTAVDGMNSVQTPVLVIAGDADKVTPIAANGGAMYTNAQGLKQMLTLKGGGHCLFSDAAGICETAASTQGESPTMPRATQQQLSCQHSRAFLDYFLKGQTTSLVFINGDSVNANTLVGNQTNIQNGSTARELAATSGFIRLYPNPLPAGQATLVCNVQPLRLSDALGRNLPTSFVPTPEGWQLSAPELQPGVYFLQMANGETQRLLVR